MKTGRIRFLLVFFAALLLTNHALASARACMVQLSAQGHAEIQVLVSGGGEHSCPDAQIAAMPDLGTSKPASVESRSAGPDSPAGELNALVRNLDFGSVSMAGGKVTHRYSIRNTGTERILIRKMFTSCMCTTSTLLKGARKFGPYGMPGHGPIPTINEPMNAGEDAIIKVVFDPAAHGPAGIGPTDRVVTIENSAGRALELAFHANVTP